MGGFFFFFLISFVVNTASVRLVFGMVSFFLSGKHLHGSLHNLREFHLFGFFIYLTTTWLDPGRVFGCIYNWAGILIQAACYLFFCVFPFYFILCLLVGYKKRGTAAMHDARPSPRQKFPFGFSIPRTFDSIHTLFRHTEAFSEDTPNKQQTPGSRWILRHSLQFFPWHFSRLTNDI